MQADTGTTKLRDEGRKRACDTDLNGKPTLHSVYGSPARKLTHLVFTRDVAAKAMLYVEGEVQ